MTAITPLSRAVPGLGQDARLSMRSAIGAPLEEAKAENIDIGATVSTLHLIELDDVVLEWARGKRRELPPDAEAHMTFQFDLR